jgi:hypothetical protein
MNTYSYGQGVMYKGAIMLICGHRVKQDRAQVRLCAPNGGLKKIWLDAEELFNHEEARRKNARAAI